jgi:hypothetical protein
MRKNTKTHKTYCEVILNEIAFDRYIRLLCCGTAGRVLKVTIIN